MRRGDVLSSHNASVGVVESVQLQDGLSTVYNLTVETDHTYFVGSGEWGFSVWAHNSTICVGGKQITIPSLKTTGSGPRGIATSDDMAREAGQIFMKETAGWSQADKAAYWAELAKQIEAVHAPAWISNAWKGANGETVFLGKQLGVHGIVIQADGTVLRIGKDVTVQLDINTGVVTVTPVPPTALPATPPKP